MALEIKLQNIWGYVQGDYPLVTTVGAELSVQHPSSKFMKARNKRWDGVIRYLTRNKRFPAGLYKYIQTNHNLIDLRDNLLPFGDVYLPDGFAKRSYQIKTIVKSLLIGSGIVNIATNGGKTFVIGSVIKTLLLNNYKQNIIVLVPKLELFTQMFDTLANTFKIDCGIINSTDINLTQVTVCMVQTLNNRMNEEDDVLDFVKNAGGVFVDECHHAVSKTYQSILSHCNARYRLGFSAYTPEKDTYEGMEVRKFLGDVIVKVSNDSLILEGISATPKINVGHIYNNQKEVSELEKAVKASLANEVGAGKKITIGTKVFAAIYDKYIVKNAVRNNTIKRIVKENKGKSILIIVDAILHGEKLNKIIKGSKFISGETKTKIRVNAFKRFKEGKQKILIATNIVDEGIDIARIEVLIFASAKKSYRQYIQRIGRGLRKKEINNVVQVFDFIDHGHRLLMQHSDTRLKLYEQEGFDIVLYE